MHRSLIITIHNKSKYKHIDKTYIKLVWGVEEKSDVDGVEKIFSWFGLIDKSIKIPWQPLTQFFQKIWWHNSRTPWLAVATRDSGNLTPPASQFSEYLQTIVTAKCPCQVNLSDVNETSTTLRNLVGRTGLLAVLFLNNFATTPTNVATTVHAAMKRNQSFAISHNQGRPTFTMMSTAPSTVPMWTPPSSSLSDRTWPNMASFVTRWTKCDVWPWPRRILV